MCDINAFLIREGKEEKIMENVDVIESSGDRITLSDIFGEQKIIRGRMLVFNNTEKRMVFEAP